MTFDSRFSIEERMSLADSVINGQQTVRQIAEKHELSRKTIDNWISRRRAELGVPTPRPGSGPVMSPRAMARIDKAEKAQAAAERRAEVAEARVVACEERVRKLLSVIDSLKGTLHVYMDPEILEAGTTA